MDRQTVDVYERRAAEWHEKRTPRFHVDAEILADRLTGEGPDGDAVPDGALVDLGCGPGWYTTHVGADTIALDAARAMLDLVPGHAPAAPRVQADLARLPFARGSVRGALASRSYVHLARADVPLALAELHAAMGVGGVARFCFFEGDLEHGGFPDDDFDTARRFSRWSPEHLTDVLIGAGFAVERYDPPEPGRFDLRITARRLRTLPDTVGRGMRLLVSGLNPSVYAADAGVGFARPGNRFWPAALAAGIVERDRDPFRALRTSGVGMTDLVKRATPRADELSADEYRAGFARLDRLAAWLQPGAVCFVGLSGWRAAVDRGARPGPQDTTMGGRPVYVMPSTSGANARTSVDEHAAHLRAAATLADGHERQPQRQRNRG